MRRIQLAIIVVLQWLVYNLSKAGGDDLIYINGFDLSEAELICPQAPFLTSDNNGLGGTYYFAFGHLSPAGDVDYYRLPAVADSWYLFDLSANSNNLPDGLDSVISIYNQDGANLTALNDDEIPFSSPDSGILIKSAFSGDLCVKVESNHVPFINFATLGVTDEYAILVVPIDFDLYDGFNLDVEPNNNTAMAQMGLSTNSVGINSQQITTIAGVFDDDTDQDVYLLPTPDSTVNLNVIVMPSGIPGNGSEQTMQSLEVVAADGNEVIAKIEPEIGMMNLTMSALPLTDYYVRTGQPDNPVTNNAHYVFQWQTADGQNPQEQDDNANDSDTGAEVASPISFGNLTSYFIGGQMTGSADTDWWQIEADSGNTIQLFCSSWQIGSGVRDLTVALHDSSAANVLQMQTEDQINGIQWTDQAGATAAAVITSSTGNHFIKLNASSFSLGVSGRIYQCGIHVFQ